MKWWIAGTQLTQTLTLTRRSCSSFCKLATSSRRLRMILVTINQRLFGWRWSLVLLEVICTTFRWTMYKLHIRTGQWSHVGTRPTQTTIDRSYFADRNRKSNEKKLPEPSHLSERRYLAPAMVLIGSCFLIDSSKARSIGWPGNFSRYRNYWPRSSSSNKLNQIA